MSTEAEKVLSIAKSEVGIKEAYSNGHWVNNSKYNKWFGTIPGYSQGGYGYPWCAVFVAWVAEKAGLKALYPKTAGCLTAVNWFKNKGRWSFYPAVGAQVFFGPNGGTHTGLVVSYDATTITTVEGNTNDDGSAEGDGVYLRKRARTSTNTYGYGLPEFAEGVTTADPALKGKSGFTYKAASAVSAPAKPSVPVFPGAQYFKAGANNAHVTQLGKQLVKKGYGRFYKVGPGPKWGDADKKAVQAFQKAQKWTGADADGYPGAETWRRLFS